MKNLITIAVVVVVALVAFNYFQSGEFKLLPGSSMSEEEQQLNSLRGEFRRAAQVYRQAGRSAGVSGMDTTADVAAALTTIEGVERDIKVLQKKSKDPEVKAKADDLLAEIRKYKDDIS